MRDCVYLGQAPAYEDCAQVGADDYYPRAKTECERYIQVIRQHCGEEPEGARLGIKSAPHDFGTYLEVVCYFDTDNAASCDYAFHLEAQAPATWEG